VGVHWPCEKTLMEYKIHTKVLNTCTKKFDDNIVSNINTRKIINYNKNLIEYIYQFKEKFDLVVYYKIKLLNNKFCILIILIIIMIWI